MGDYEGMIFISSNDPLNSEVEIPVYFTVDMHLNYHEFIDLNLYISNFPNPFNEYTEFVLDTKDASSIELFIYNSNGQVD